MSLKQIKVLCVLLWAAMVFCYVQGFIHGHIISFFDTLVVVIIITFSTIYVGKLLALPNDE